MEYYLPWNWSFLEKGAVSFHFKHVVFIIDLKINEAHKYSLNSIFPNVDLSENDVTEKLFDIVFIVPNYCFP